MLRSQLAALLAWYFCRHLRAELQKGAELLGRVTTEGDTFGENTGALLCRTA